MNNLTEKRTPWTRMLLFWFALGLSSSSELRSFKFYIEGKSLFQIWSQGLHRYSWNLLSPKPQWYTISHLLRLPKWKKHINYREDMEKLELFYTARGVIKWCSPCGKQLIVPQNVKYKATIWPICVLKRNKNTSTRKFVQLCLQKHYSSWPESGNNWNIH